MFFSESSHCRVVPSIGQLVNWPWPLSSRKNSADGLSFLGDRQNLLIFLALQNANGEVANDCSQIFPSTKQGPGPGMCKKTIFLLLVFLCGMSVGDLNPGRGQDSNLPEPPQKRLPNVLILGDSISIGYTPYVKKALLNTANVVRPTLPQGRAENCAGTVNGIKHIERWLAAGNHKWSVIHFNFGLHDLKRVDPKNRKNSNDPAHPRQSEPADYEKQLTEIVEKLLKTKARLIFATTTPVPQGGVKPHRDVQDPNRYNAIALKIMKANGIAVNDLYTAAQPKIKKIMRPVNVHFTKEGSEFLGQKVVKAIQEQLGQ